MVATSRALGRAGEVDEEPDVLAPHELDGRARAVHLGAHGAERPAGDHVAFTATN